ncbi:hypothetical protein TrVE_jg4570 [Triparma verrucosa]|uniref:BZIP domain-containing protein n=1 Tax=Triparma verrucosa TaxID=1606542 RepID=A0A9W7F052_9STRA|nr:hypothetical protein TrVE_jg4570 [Triparma verrucosa]
MTSHELSQWRAEQRRQRNRASAAASRLKNMPKSKAAALLLKKKDHPAYEGLNKDGTRNKKEVQPPNFPAINFVPNVYFPMHPTFNCNMMLPSPGFNFVYPSNFMGIVPQVVNQVAMPVGMGGGGGASMNDLINAAANTDINAVAHSSKNSTETTKSPPPKKDENPSHSK